ncbi:MAG TPA: DUF2625 family protein [Kofleriaceae bacterium]|nr:DUF2625 family protein [Kofleriaceae bacterium]
MRPLEELLDPVPALPSVTEWAAASIRTVETLPVEAGAGAPNLLALQVSTRSALGAIAYGTGGILVDHGWLRILGAGSPRLPRSIARWNRLEAPPDRHRLPGALLVADDVAGGFYAVNGGGLAGPVGHVLYLAPDTGRWEELAMAHTDWIYWVFSGDVDKFYASLRWAGWEAEAEALAADRAITIASGSRASVSIEEAWELHAI